MITAETAYKACQDANKANWIKLLETRISNIIEDAANQGRSGVEVTISDYILGAENLSEYREMLFLFEKVLRNNKFSHKILPNGKLVISWK